MIKALKMIQSEEEKGQGKVTGSRGRRRIWQIA